MFRFEADLTVFLHREPIDFRAGINSLVTLVEQSMQLDPYGRAVFAFHNRKRNRVKLLFYDRNGFWMMLRRLEEDHFVWPHRQQSVVKLTSEQLHWLRRASTLMLYAAIPYGRTITPVEHWASPVSNNWSACYKFP